MRGHDAIVVGGGIVGAACAWELARVGQSVLVLEAAAGTSGGATAAGMGHIVVADDSEPQFALCKWSRRLWDELADDLPVGVQRELCGCLWLAVDDPRAMPDEIRSYAGRGIVEQKGRTSYYTGESLSPMRRRPGKRAAY